MTRVLPALCRDHCGIESELASETYLRMYSTLTVLFSDVRLILFTQMVVRMIALFHTYCKQGLLEFSTLYIYINVYIYIYMCVCVCVYVCVCVCVRERERERECVCVYVCIFS